MAAQANKPSKAAAAKAEREQSERTVEWQGLTLTLPAELPEAVLMDLALVKSEEDPTTTFEMLKTMIGVGQFRQVRNKLDSDKDVTLAEVASLVGQVFEAYGTSEGESEASQDS
jgi:hypothetical protein